MSKLILSHRDKALHIRKQLTKTKEQELLALLIEADMTEFIKTGKVSKKSRLV